MLTPVATNAGTGRGCPPYAAMLLEAREGRRRWSQPTFPGRAQSVRRRPPAYLCPESPALHGGRTARPAPRGDRAGKGCRGYQASTRSRPITRPTRRPMPERNRVLSQVVSRTSAGQCHRRAGQAGASSPPRRPRRADAAVTAAARPGRPIPASPATSRGRRLSRSGARSSGRFGRTSAGMSSRSRIKPRRRQNACPGAR